MANPNPVSRKGVPNKATAAAREAIGMFVDNNAHRLQLWLDQVAEGTVIYDKEGNVSEVITPPNPERAFQLFQSVIEYHVPKLARTETSGDMSVAVKRVTVERVASPNADN